MSTRNPYEAPLSKPDSKWKFDSVTKVFWFLLWGFAILFNLVVIALAYLLQNPDKLWAVEQWIRSF